MAEADDPCEHADRWGYAATTGFILNLPMIAPGDRFSIQAVYSQGATGYHTANRSAGSQLSARSEGKAPRERYAIFRQRSGKEQLAGSPPQIRTCSSRASRGEQRLVPSPAGHAEKQPFDKRFVQSQNPDPS